MRWIKYSEIGVFHFDEKAFAGFQFVALGRVARERGSNTFQSNDGATVVCQLKVSQADVVVSLIDLRTCWKRFNDSPHQLEALAIISEVIKTDAHFQRGFAALRLVGVVFATDSFKLNTGLLISPVTVQEVIAQTHVSFKTDFASRVAFDDRLPDFDCLGKFLGIKSSISSGNQFLCRPVFHQRCPGWWLPMSRTALQTDQQG